MVNDIRCVLPRLCHGSVTRRQKITDDDDDKPSDPFRVNFQIENVLVVDNFCALHKHLGKTRNRLD